MKLQLIPILLKDSIDDLISHRNFKYYRDIIKVYSYLNTNEDALKLHVSFIINNRNIKLIHKHILEIILDNYKDKIKIRKYSKLTWHTTIRYNKNLADELYNFTKFFYSGTPLSLKQIK